VSDADANIPPHPKEGETDLVLRAKYMEYCSGQVAEHLLLLTPDEIYLLAEEAHRLEGGEGNPTYEGMVRLATSGVSRRLALPPFDDWAQDYARNPAQYEAQFLGLWESELRETLDP
jgi:hypothetical protein